MTSAQIAIMTTIILYLCLVIFTGVMIGKRSKKSAEGFYLGGRGMGPLVTAMSAEASDMSSYLLMGIPGLAYLSGVADASWTAIGLAIGTYLNFLLVARGVTAWNWTLSPSPALSPSATGRKSPSLWVSPLSSSWCSSCPMWPPAWRRSVSCSTVCSAGIICSP